MPPSHNLATIAQLAAQAGRPDLRDMILIEAKRVSLMEAENVRMEHALDEIVADAQEAGEAHIEALNQALRAGVLVELRPRIVRRIEIGVLV